MTLNAMLRLQFGFGTSVTSSTKARQVGYLPGGTASVIWGNASGRIEAKISDPLGRYSCMAL